jgi:hypothetical protein
VIYFLFTLSFLVYLTLKIIQSYYEYFNVETAPKNVKDKPHGNNFLSFLSSKVPSWNFLKLRKPNWILKAKKAERKLAIVKGISHFLGIFCCIAFIFCLLQLWIDNATNIALAESTVLKIEKTQFKIKNFISYFKIDPNYDILIIVILIVLAGSLPFVEHYKLKDKFKKFNKVVKNVLYILTISTSFTFFGNTFSTKEEGRIGELQIHKLQIIENNKLLLKQINQEVTEKVVNEILKSPKVESVLDKIEEAKQNIQTATSSDDYKNYVSLAAASLVNKLTLSTFENSFNQNYNFSSGFESAESQFESAYRQNSSNPESNFYKSKEEVSYPNFKESNKQWFDEKNFSEKSTKQAEEAFTTVKQASDTKFSKYYSKYKEPIDKLIKKGYKNTSQKWIKDIFEMLGVDFPFMDEFINPIINEPVEEFITKETETIFKNSCEGKSETIASELNKCSAEFKTTFENSVNESSKFKIIENSVKADLVKSRTIASITKNEIKTELNKVDGYFQKLKANDEWEVIRIAFYRQLLDGDFTRLPGYMETIYQSALEEWNRYLDANKLKLFLSNANNLESLFIVYAKENSKLTAAWGYVLLSERENEIAEMFPTSNHLRPYEALRYYFRQNGIVGQEFTNIYTLSVDQVVDILCPH